MQTYRIDKGLRIPAPQKSRSGGQPGKAALTMQRLAVAGSFLVKDPREIFPAEKAMRGFNRREAQRKGTRRFVSRRVKGGLRIWRIA